MLHNPKHYLLCQDIKDAIECSAFREGMGSEPWLGHVLQDAITQLRTSWRPLGFYDCNYSLIKDNALRFPYRAVAVYSLLGLSCVSCL